MTKDEYDKAIQSAKVVVVDFWAPWCAPCKDLGPRLETELKKFPDHKLIKINIDEDDVEIAKSLNIRAIPTLIVYLDGLGYERIVGNQSASQLNTFLTVPKPTKKEG